MAIMGQNQISRAWQEVREARGSAQGRDPQIGAAVGLWRAGKPRSFGALMMSLIDESKSQAYVRNRSRLFSCSSSEDMIDEKQS